MRRITFVLCFLGITGCTPNFNPEHIAKHAAKACGDSPVLFVSIDPYVLKDTIVTCKNMNRVIGWFPENPYRDQSDREVTNETGENK